MGILSKPRWWRSGGVDEGALPSSWVTADLSDGARAAGRMEVVLKCGLLEDSRGGSDVRANFLGRKRKDCWVRK